jgi:PAS domain S-box-containing protein
MTCPVMPLAVDYVEGLMDGFLAFDAKGRICYMNAAAEQQLRRPRSEVLGRAWQEVFPGGEGEAIEAMYRRVTESRAAERAEFFTEHSARWIEASASPVANGGFAVSFRDVTDRRRTEADLRMLAAVVENTSDFVGLCTPDLKPFHVNEAGRRMVGLEGRDVTHTHVLDYFWPEDLPRIQSQAVPALLRDGRWSGEVRFRHFVTGKPIPTMWNAFVIRGADGKPLAWATISPDLEAVKRTEAKLEALIENLPVGIGTSDLQGNILSLNDAALALYDIPSREQRFRSWREMVKNYEIRSVDGTPLPVKEWPIAKALRGEFVSGHEVCLINRSTGGERIVAYSTFPVRGGAGEMEQLVYLIQDITQHRRNEEALRRANEQLQEGAQRKDEFIATLAHELRNPLAPIAHAVEILNLRAPEDPLLHSTCDVVERQVRHMVRLIDDLLDVSRVTSGKLKLRVERVDLARVLDQALETARPYLRGHELTISMPPEPVWVDVDPVRLAQVLANLLGNAGKYTPGAGKICLGIERRAEQVVVIVRDTGIGISAEYLPHVFEMFSQAAPALERPEGGLGIGLALARALVQMHGGALTAASDGPGTGSEFAVTLPACADARIASPSGERAAPPQPPQRILVVEDNVDAATSLAALLRLDGHTVEVANDGEAALDAAAAFHPDTILLDIGLPGMNGYDTCRALRARAGGGALRIAALTGWGQEKDQRQAREAGFDVHLVKPVTRQMLLSVLRAPHPA